MATSDRGFDITSQDATVKVLVTTIHQNLRKLDPEIHCELLIKHNFDKLKNMQ